MSSIIDQIKEKMEKLKEISDRKKQEAEKNFVKRYFSDFTRAARGDNMTIIADEKGEVNYYISRGSHDPFTYAAGYISSLRNVIMTEENDFDDLMKYGCVIVEAYPKMICDNAIVYMPEDITEAQEKFIEEFKKQVQEYNEKNENAQVGIKTVRNVKENTEENGMTL